MPIKLKKKPSASAYTTATNSTGGSPAKKRDEDDEKRYQDAAEKYAAKNVQHGIGETIDDPRKSETVANIRSAYKKKNQSPNAEATNGGKRTQSKTRPTGSTTHTVAGVPVKGKSQVVAKEYGKGTSGIKIKKKGC